MEPSFNEISDNRIALNDYKSFVIWLDAVWSPCGNYVIGLEID